MPGRHALDNVVVGKEFVHSVTKAKRGPVIIKLDQDKVYDWLEWSFIVSILRDAGIPEDLILVIVRMVSRGPCRLKWNGEKTDAIKLTRGLR